MTPDTFLLLADPLPEPMLLLSADGLILAANEAAQQRLDLSPAALPGKRLGEVVLEAADEVARYLRICSRSRKMVLGSFTLRGGGLACRAEGSVVRPKAAGCEALLLLRLTSRDSTIGHFVALNERIDDLGKEIQQRRRAEEAARQEQQRLRVTLHSIGDGVIVTDPEGRVTAMNPVAESLSGWTHAEALGRPLEDVFVIINENSRGRVENPAGRALREGLVVGLANHTVLVARDGTEHPIDDSAAPIRDGNGEVFGAVLVFRDIFKRRRSEEMLLASEARFRQLADAMPQIVWTARPDGVIDYSNGRWFEFTGAQGASTSEAWHAIVHPDDMPQAARRWAESLRSGQPFETELRLYDRRSQSYRWHLLRTVPICNDAGSVERWFGTATDIDGQKQAADTARFLAEASAALAALVDYESTLQKVVALAVPYFADWAAVDAVGDDGKLRRLAVAHREPEKIRLAHELMRRYPPTSDSSSGSLYAFRSGEAIFVSGITDEMLVQAARDDDHLRLLRGLGLHSYICVPLTVSGQPLGVLTFATAESGRSYKDADLALARDLADRAAIAVENARLYRALRDADRRKDEFLATLAHELRNPLAPIRNSLQILSMPRLDPATVERSRAMIERQVHHLVRLVDDLLDMSRVMRGKIELRKERVELASVVARAVEMVQPLVEAQSHELSIQLPGESLLLEVDPVRMAQVIGNLLTNSAKYTDPGGKIWLSARRERSEVVLSVKDTGIGLAAEMLPRVFELFVQADHGPTKAQGGLGIGLTLVKNLVEMHRGTVVAHSAGPGQGCEMVVRLPLVAPESPPPRGEDGDRKPQGVSRHRLVVADDNQDAALSLAMLLRLLGHEVQVAHDGTEALQLATTHLPDLMFLDIGMPGMDGYQVARQIRKTSGLDKVVLVALTGWAQQEDRRRTAEAGFDHHLVKPPEPKALERLLADLPKKKTRK